MTTTVCNKCGSTALSLMYGNDKKVCVDCSNEIFWPLEDGQKSILIDNKVGKGEVSNGACS